MSGATRTKRMKKVNPVKKKSHFFWLILYPYINHLSNLPEIWPFKEGNLIFLPKLRDIKNFGLKRSTDQGSTTFTFFNEIW